MYRKVAAIDVGSNAARLLIAKVVQTPSGFKAQKIILIRIPLRLGEDSFTQGIIGQQRINMLVRIMRAFAYLMRLHQVEVYMAYATSALREASNTEEILQRIQQKTALSLNLLTVNEEALFLYESYSVSQLAVANNYLYVDVGGGSTEIILLVNGKLVDAKRFSLGTIRSLTGNDNKQEKAEMITYLMQLREKYAPVAIIGTGGNINKIAQLTGTTRDHVVTLRSLQRLYNKLRQISVEGRISVFDLNPDRADVIVPACDIFIIVAKTAGISKFIVPTIGIVDGMVQLLAEKINQKTPHSTMENVPTNEAMLVEPRTTQLLNQDSTSYLEQDESSWEDFNEFDDEFDDD